MAVYCVEKAKQYCDDVEFSPMDASRTDMNFLYQLIEATVKAGATTINIPDTVGYTMPWEFKNRIENIIHNVPGMDKIVTSVHCHNDLGLSVSNSLAAITAGARQIEGCINGLGERAGNAALEEVIMAIETRKDLLNVKTDINTKEIYKTSRLVSDITGLYAFPLTTIFRKNISNDIEKLYQLIIEKEANELIIGLPLLLSGEEGAQVRLVKSFVNLLNKKIDIPIYYIDERYSTVQAEDKLMNAGIRPSKNQEKIDSAAAAIILQSYLDKIK